MSDSNEIILTKEEYGELVSNENDNGYARGFREAVEEEKREFAEILDKISAEIKEKAFTEEIFDEDVFRSIFTESMTREEAEDESVIETEIVKLPDILEIIERYKGVSE